MIFGIKQRRREREIAQLPESVSTRFTALHDSLSALQELEVSHEILDSSTQFLQHSDARRIRWGQHTVAALLGGSGSGKSALFNRLTGGQMREVSVARPTSTDLGAAIWPQQGSSETPVGDPAVVLDQLGVAQRTVAKTPGPGGLILIDAPDLDSVAQEHWHQARMIADNADVLIWVVDPQKYADEQLHKNFLSGYAHLAPLTLVVLNQADLLSAADQRAVTDHLAQILQSVGFDENQLPQIIATSAVTGQGTQELMDQLAQLAQRHSAVYQRMDADAENMGHALLEVFPLPSHIHPPEVNPALVQGIAEAAGLPEVTATHTRILRKQYRLWGGKKPAPTPGSTRQLQVDEHQLRRVRRVLFDWFRPWAESVGQIWAPILEHHAHLEQSADEIAGSMGQWWSMRGELAPYAHGARFLQVMRWLGLSVTLLGVLWLLADHLGPLVNIYLNDPPFMVVGSLGEFGYPVVLIVLGLAWFLLWSIINVVTRNVVIRRHRRKLVRWIEHHLDESLHAMIDHTLAVRLHTLGQYRNSVLQLTGKPH